MLHIDKSFKCKYSFYNLNFIIRFQYRKINVEVFVAMEQFEFFPLIPLVCHSNVIYMPCKWSNIRLEFDAIQTD